MNRACTFPIEYFPLHAHTKMTRAFACLLGNSSLVASSASSRWSQWIERRDKKRRGL